ncbi:hypothetical protein EVAR_11899_1 [Eumeta japonica]|uniref:Uncharacterized protein n=1 Tax=Eumeta variegata TaxID=151549 RepID=A0A4C1U7J9_EUMVA|nr:hypothetical protein EVAR_11899_1 [Eumeta japonica]
MFIHVILAFARDPARVEIECIPSCRTSTDHAANHDPDAVPYFDFSPGFGFDSVSGSFKFEHVLFESKDITFGIRNTADESRICRGIVDNSGEQPLACTGQALKAQNPASSMLVERSSADAVKGGVWEPGVSADRLFKYVKSDRFSRLSYRRGVILRACDVSEKVCWIYSRKSYVDQTDCSTTHEIAAVKLVTKQSQWRKIEMRERRKGRGTLNLRSASFAGNSERQSFMGCAYLFPYLSDGAQEAMLASGTEKAQTKKKTTKEEIKQSEYEAVQSFLRSISSTATLPPYVKGERYSSRRGVINQNNFFKDTIVIEVAVSGNSSSEHQRKNIVLPALEQLTYRYCAAQPLTRPRPRLYLPRVTLNLSPATISRFSQCGWPRLTRRVHAVPGDVRRAGAGGGRRPPHRLLGRGAAPAPRRELLHARRRRDGLLDRNDNYFVFLFPSIGRRSGREIETSQAERTGRSCLSFARTALSLARSAQAERDNE